MLSANVLSHPPPMGMTMKKTKQHDEPGREVGAALSGAAAVLSVVAACSIVSMAGCAAPPVVKPDPVRLALERAVEPDPDLGRHTNSAEAAAVPADVRGARITMRGYIGTGQDVLSKVAKARGMRFLVTGPEPHLPLLVTVDMANAKFEDFLANISLQFGGRAKVVLGDDRIEIRYSDAIGGIGSMGERTNAPAIGPGANTLGSMSDAQGVRQGGMSGGRAGGPAGGMNASSDSLPSGRGQSGGQVGPRGQGAPSGMGGPVPDGGAGAQ